MEMIYSSAYIPSGSGKRFRATRTVCSQNNDSSVFRFTSIAIDKPGDDTPFMWEYGPFTVTEFTEKSVNAKAGADRKDKQRLQAITMVRTLLGEGNDTICFEWEKKGYMNLSLCFGKE
jgi:hypothetical protein